MPIERSADRPGGYTTDAIDGPQSRVVTGNGVLRVGWRLFATMRISEPIMRQLGWTTSGYLAAQVVRFGTNLFLTRLLAPDLFGIMQLLTALRVGVELFTDIGVGQSVISSRHASEERFYNTAWTIQVVRGALLVVIALTLLPLVGRALGLNAIEHFIPVLALFFALSAFPSMGWAMAIRRRDRQRIALVETAAALIGSIALVAIVFAVPTLSGLILGNLVGGLVTTVSSYFMTKGVRHRFTLEPAYVREIVSFGKWIFLSSLLMFLAGNYDRLALAKYISLTMLGIYGIARSLTDIVVQFAAKLGNSLIFPAVAAIELRGWDLQERLRPKRLQLLLVAAVILAGLIVVSDVLVGLLYDPRYAFAGRVLPPLAMAAWFGILALLHENVFLGLGRPSWGSAANAIKLLGLVVLLPLLVTRYGVAGAAVATLAAEMLRWAAFIPGQFRERVIFVRQDLAVTAILVVVAVVVRKALSMMGLTSPLVL